MRVKSERPTRNGGWLHIFGAAFIPAKDLKPTHVIHDRAASTHLDHIYATLIAGHLVLAEEHKQALCARGLDHASVERNGYRSVPGPLFARNVARALSIYNLKGVPGFYFTNKWEMVTPGQGILIPIRDSRMRIRGFQVRLDEGSPRYKWFSSASKPEGASSGAPIHFSKSHLLKEQGKAVITEGGLKADVIAHKLNTCVIGLPGVSSFPPAFGAKLKQACPALKQVSIAFDADFKTNGIARRHLFRLLDDLCGVGLQPDVWVWNEQKGLDDYLVAA